MLFEASRDLPIMNQALWPIRARQQTRNSFFPIDMKQALEIKIEKAQYKLVSEKVDLALSLTTPTLNYDVHFRRTPVHFRRTFGDVLPNTGWMVDPVLLDVARNSNYNLLHSLSAVAVSLVLLLAVVSHLSSLLNLL